MGRRGEFHGEALQRLKKVAYIGVNDDWGRGGVEAYLGG